MSDRIVAIVILVFVLFIGGLAWSAFHYYGKAVEQQKEIAQAKQDLTDAQYLIKSQAATAIANNVTAGDTLNVQASNKQESAKTQVIIKKVLVTAPCAAVDVPADAADSLLDKFRQVSASAARANPSKPVAALPAVSTTK